MVEEHVECNIELKELFDRSHVFYHEFISFFIQFTKGSNTK